MTLDHDLLRGAPRLFINQIAVAATVGAFHDLCLAVDPTAAAGVVDATELGVTAVPQARFQAPRGVQKSVYNAVATIWFIKRD